MRLVAAFVSLAAAPVLPGAAASSSTASPARSSAARPGPAAPAAPSAAATPAAPAQTPQEFEAQLRLQIFLDGAGFGPGVVDGRPGEFTRKAVAAWNVAHDVEDVDDLGRVGREAARSVRTVYAAYTVKPGDLAFVTPGLPTKPELQAKQKYLGYRSLAEFVAERFHTTEAVLARLNPKVALGALKAGVVLKVPNVEPFEIEALPSQRGWKADDVLSRHAVLINVRHKTAAIYDDRGDLMALFPITPGREKFVPYGEWTLATMVSTPVFRWDKQLLEEGKHSQTAHLLPPGPNSPVGVLWAGTNRKGIGLHGTATPETIGRSQSAGCIRFANWDAVRLPKLLRPGSRVIVK